MEQKKYEISKEFIEKSGKQVSGSLVGRVLSKIEMREKIYKGILGVEGYEVLKGEIKNEIYEHFRDYVILLESFDSGIQFKVNVIR